MVTFSFTKLIFNYKKISCDMIRLSLLSKSCYPFCIKEEVRVTKDAKEKIIHFNTWELSGVHSWFSWYTLWVFLGNEPFYNVVSCSSVITLVSNEQNHPCLFSRIRLVYFENYSNKKNVCVTVVSYFGWVGVFEIEQSLKTASYSTENCFWKLKTASYSYSS